MAREQKQDATGPAGRKQELRRALRAARRSRYGGEDGAERRAAEAQALLTHAEGILARVAKEAAAGRAPQVACFRPGPVEADLMPLARALHEEGATLLFPVAAGTPELDWAVWDGAEDSFVRSPGAGFGDEPTGERRGVDALRHAALVLAPALAVDRSGTRLGHGGGYYDRALSHVGPRTRVVAVVQPAELLAPGALPRETFDRPVGEVLTAECLERVGHGTAP